MFNKEKELFGLLQKASNYIKKHDFEEALKLYAPIDNKFKRLPKNKKLRLIERFSIFKDQMLLYLKIKEAFVLIQNKKLSFLKENLDYIKLLKNKLKSDIKDDNFFHFVDENYKYCLNFYYFHNSKIVFYKKLDDVYYMLRNRGVEDVIAEYRRLLESYNIMVRFASYDERRKIYNKLLDLTRLIRLTILKQKAFAPAAKQEIKISRKKEPELKIPRPTRSIQTTTIASFDDNFRRIHELIKKGNFEEANKIYNQL